MSLYQVTFESHYSLQDTEHPPVCALDGNGNPEAGFGCNRLTDHGSDCMMSPGCVFLCELFHWPYLFEKVPGYSAVVNPAYPVARQQLMIFQARTHQVATVSISRTDNVLLSFTVCCRTPLN
jgi:hypothetical protein